MPKRIRPIRLTVFHAGSAINTGLVFERSPIRIGRMLDNDIVVPFRYVSRYHCELRFMRGRWYVVDLGSKNGMYNEGEQRAHQVELDDLTEFRLQDVTILFEIDHEEEEEDDDIEYVRPHRAYRTLTDENTRVETTRPGGKDRRGQMPTSAHEPTKTHHTRPATTPETFSESITATWNVFTGKLSDALERIGL